MIRFKHKGDFKHTEHFFKKARERSYLNTLKKYVNISLVLQHSEIQ